MFWGYVLVNILLVFPGSRIFGVNSFVQQQEPSGKSFSEEADEDLIDTIRAEFGEGGVQQEGDLLQDKTTSRTVSQDDPSPQNSDVVPVLPKSDLNLQVLSQGGTEVGQPPGGALQVHSGVVSSGPPPEQQQHEKSNAFGELDRDDAIFIIVIVVVVVIGFLGLVLAGVCYFRLRVSGKAASEVEYPAYKGTGPAKGERSPSAGDRKLAQSAQMFHYQHQKQQMIAMEKANGYMKHDASEDDTDEGNMDGDYTVYECPGLAPVGEMEVRNPLFRVDDPDPAGTPGQDLSSQPQEQEPQPTPQQDKH